MLKKTGRQMNVIISDEARDAIKSTAKENGMLLTEFIEQLGVLMARQPWLGKMIKMSTIEGGIPLDEYSLEEVTLRFKVYLTEFAALAKQYNPELAFEKWLDIVTAQNRVIYVYDPEAKQLVKREVAW